MKFYQPSGKVSGWFYLYFLVCVVGIVPLFAYGYTLAAEYIIRPILWKLWQPLGEGTSIILTAPIPDSRIYSCGGDTILREVKKWMREISL